MHCCGKPNAWLNGLSFRPDLGRFANNSVADSATACASYYADIATYTPDLAPGLSPLDLLRFAAEQILVEPKALRYSDVRTFPNAVTSTIDCAWLYIAASGDWAWAEKMKHALMGDTELLLQLEYKDTGLVAAESSGRVKANISTFVNWCTR